MRRLIAILLLSSFAAFSSAAEARKGTPKCTLVQSKAADRQLWLNRRDQQLFIETHLPWVPWGTPSATAPVSNERVLVQRDYVADYDADLLVALWSAERVDAKRLGGSRIDCFRSDPRLTTNERSTKSDYNEAIYDLGHLTPSADQTASITSTLNSFVLSNMTPQTCPFNEGIWQIFEGIARLWATKNKAIFLINGSVFDRDADGVRDADENARRMHSKNGKERVGVPSSFYKIVAFELPSGHLATLSVMVPNDMTMLSGQGAVDSPDWRRSEVAECVCELRRPPGSLTRPFAA